MVFTPFYTLANIIKDKKMNGIFESGSAGSKSIQEKRHEETGSIPPVKTGMDSFTLSSDPDYPLLDRPGLEP